MTESAWKHRWDDPDNPVVDTHYMGFGVFINVRQRDVELGETLGMAPERLAIARQPIGHGREAFDLAEPQEPS